MKNHYLRLKRGLLLFALALTYNLSYSQSKVTGRITDSQDNTPIPGVNILVKGTTTGTSSDANGNYSLTLPTANSTLVFSFTGYTSQDVPVNGKSTINIELEPSSQLLNEVVVVGYGTRRKSDVTGSVAQVGFQGL